MISLYQSIPVPDSVPVSPGVYSAELQQVDLSQTQGWCTTEHAQYVSSAAGGGIAGGLASIISSECFSRSVVIIIELTTPKIHTGHGLKSILLTGCGGLVCGFCGQLLYNRLEIWRKRKAIEIHYPELIERKESQWTFVRLSDYVINYIIVLT